MYLPLHDFMNLEFHLMDTRPGVKPQAFVTELVQHWLTVDKERHALRKHGQPMRGSPVTSIGSEPLTSGRASATICPATPDR